MGKTLNISVRKNTHFAMLQKGNHHSPYLQNAYKKYGRRSFYFEVLEENISETDISQREIWWIAHFDSYNNGYNMTTGGDVGGYKTPRKCSWNGVEYASVKEAALAIGITTQSMRKRINQGKSTDSEMGVERPTVWNGVQYSSIAEAARALGITIASMHRRTSKGQTCDDDRQTYRPITWNGVKYPHVNAAARDLGIHCNTMRHRISKGWASDSEVPDRRAKS